VGKSAGEDDIASAGLTGHPSRSPLIGGAAFCAKAVADGTTFGVRTRIKSELVPGGGQWHTESMKRREPLTPIDSGAPIRVHPLEAGPQCDPPGQAPFLAPHRDRA